ncbi:hypothetical protein BT96DRAFT_934244 [Gymnopus androsaceus JB14]|uniref:Uncharacterized protein n=1 Tax=Gymnopus androsaceus JB14 TaxID=1447944 RepID=A0A6A4I8Q3_9AGAR|nr:hypothetical protein BT96DRAFT_934244 [Gymnopus androsaceus JB14]
MSPITASPCFPAYSSMEGYRIVRTMQMSPGKPLALPAVNGNANEGTMGMVKESLNEWKRKLEKEGTGYHSQNAHDRRNELEWDVHSNIVPIPASSPALRAKNPPPLTSSPSQTFSFFSERTQTLSFLSSFLFSSNTHTSLVDWDSDIDLDELAEANVIEAPNADADDGAVAPREVDVDMGLEPPPPYGGVAAAVKNEDSESDDSCTKSESESTFHESYFQFPNHRPSQTSYSTNELLPREHSTRGLVLGYRYPQS